MQEPQAQQTASPQSGNGQAADKPTPPSQQAERPLPATGPDARPLGGYAILMGAFLGTHLAVSALARRAPPLGALDLAALSLASFRLGRMINTDQVTSFLRAPFVEMHVEGSGDEASVEEVPAGSGLRLAVGQLVKCSSCSGFWAAGFQLWGLMLAPRVARPLVWIIAANGAGELIELAAERLQKAQKSA
jgi:hypothetical protein